MSATLLDDLRQRTKADLTRALAVYRALIRRNTDPKPGDGELLAATVETLGLRPADVESDLAELRKHSEAADEVLPPERIEAMRAEQQETAAAALAEVRAKMRERLDLLGPLDIPEMMMQLDRLTRWGLPRHEAEQAFRVGYDHSRINLQNATENSRAAERRAASIEHNNPRVFAGE